MGSLTGILTRQEVWSGMHPQADRLPLHKLGRQGQHIVCKEASSWRQTAVGNEYSLSTTM